MTDNECTTAIEHFAEFWQDKSYEKGESQSFWLTLLSKVLGVAELMKAYQKIIENKQKC